MGPASLPLHVRDCETSSSLRIASVISDVSTSDGVGNPCVIMISSAEAQSCGVSGMWTWFRAPDKEIFDPEVMQWPLNKQAAIKKTDT